MKKIIINNKKLKSNLKLIFQIKQKKIKTQGFKLFKMSC